jgi:hypothetical protein
MSLYSVAPISPATKSLEFIGIPHIHIHSVTAEECMGYGMTIYSVQSDRNTDEMPNHNAIRRRRPTLRSAPSARPGLCVRFW